MHGGREEEKRGKVGTGERRGFRFFQAADGAARGRLGERGERGKAFGACLGEGLAA